MSVSPFYYQPYPSGFYGPNKAFYIYPKAPQAFPPAQQQGQSQQAGHNAFYSGYESYISPSQHPLVMQEMNAAANNWFLESAGKFPWAQVVPTWTDAGRMWLRGAHERWTSRNPNPRESIQNMYGTFVRDFTRLG